jgi:serine protease Do
MKQIIKKGAFILLAMAMVAPVFAQKDDKVKEKEKEKKETEQIVISRNGDKKIVVEVDGNKVTVNGKPLEDYTGGDVTVLHNRIKDLNALSGGYSQLFNNDGFRALTTTGDANRPMLGVVTEKAEKGGAAIQSVTKESGAEKAGLKKGDVITKVGDTKIETPDDLTKAIRAHKAGDKIDITYLRDKKEQKANAELSKYKGVTAYTFSSPGGQNYFGGVPMPDMKELESLSIPRVRTAPGQQFSWNWSGGSPKMGLSVQDTEDGKGVKVVDVDEESNAAKAGIKEDDVITEVDGQAVNSADEIAKIIRDSKEKVSVKMKLNRNGKSETLDVKIPRRLKTADL